MRSYQTNQILNIKFEQSVIFITKSFEDILNTRRSRDPKMFKVVKVFRIKTDRNCKIYDEFKKDFYYFLSALSSILKNEFNQINYKLYVIQKKKHCNIDRCNGCYSVEKLNIYIELLRNQAKSRTSFVNFYLQGEKKTRMRKKATNDLFRKCTRSRVLSRMDSRTLHS